ncbi:hypothetical protein TNCV_3496091 [Trichonephila clavipes]|nr:hypothetical protein TNCV_3496091 [Trichonephila clavipes]
MGTTRVSRLPEMDYSILENGRAVTPKCLGSPPVDLHRLNAYLGSNVKDLLFKSNTFLYSVVNMGIKTMLLEKSCDFL